jgi:L-fuconolactonase
MTPTIDAHHHFWQLSKPFDYRWLDAPALAAIRRDYLPADLAPHLQGAGIKHSIFVQTQHNSEETRWVLDLAEQYPFIAGVVGWVDLASPAVEEQVLTLKAHPKFVGVRHVVQDEPDPDWIVRPEVLRGLKVLEKQGVPYDLLFYVKHLRHAATVAHHCPGLRLVIDHLGKPRIKDHVLDDWLPHFEAAARYENVFCKLSGMVTEADWQHWQPGDLKPYVEKALALFGPQRLMYGSDWPVCELAATYDRQYAALQEVLGPISAGERDAIFGGTAASFYRLKLT